MHMYEKSMGGVCPQLGTDGVYYVGVPLLRYPCCSLNK